MSHLIYPYFSFYNPLNLKYSLYHRKLKQKITQNTNNYSKLFLLVLTKGIGSENVKGLEHGEREKIVFPAIEDLKKEENLEIVFEFNPIPLVYMLKSRNGFNVSFLKERPDEWILSVKRDSNEKKLNANEKDKKDYKDK